MSAMHAHDGYKPHSHEVRADHMGIDRVAQISDRRALDLVAAILHGASDWNADTANAVADIVRLTGRSVSEEDDAPAPVAAAGREG